MKNQKNKKLWSLNLGCAPMLVLTALMLLMTFQTASAQIAIPPPTSGDTAVFAQIAQPIWKVYNFVKYIATVIAALVLLFAGILFVMSSQDVTRRENAKHTIAYVVIGLVVIWVTPFVVQVLTV